MEVRYIDQDEDVMIKYVIIPGSVISKDGDEHFISSTMLRKLYNVNPMECYFLPSDVRFFQTSYQNELIDKYITLEPREDGDYSLERAKADFARRKLTE